MIIHNLRLALIPLLIGAGVLSGFAEGTSTSTSARTNIPPSWLTQPLSLADALNQALRQNGTILRAKSDLEAQYGVVVQTRAIALPRLQVNGTYEYTKEVQTFPTFQGPPGFPSFNFPFPNQTWNTSIQLVQTIYQGGQINSALRSAKLTKQQALLQYQTVIADSLLQVRIAYYDILQAAEQVTVEEASVKLLTQQFEDQKRRYDAGTVPRFNVLQAEVALSNERPRLIQARNALRVGKNNLVNLLGYNVPPQVWEDIPLQLTDKLDADPYPIDLPIALAKALENRTELAALRKAEALRKEGVISAKGGYKPTVQLFGGYGAENSQFTNDPGQNVRGPMAGAQVSWNIFDGFLTQGKIKQAKALYEGSQVDVDNEARSIELEVRTDYSNFIEATETLESQKKVQEEADEALRLATARNDAGTGTQLDVLQAQTALTQARSTQVQALHDYDVARARFERAIGVNIMQTMK
jgi:outer membrane protein